MKKMFRNLLRSSKASKSREKELHIISNSFIDFYEASSLDKRVVRSTNSLIAQTLKLKRKKEFNPVEVVVFHSRSCRSETFFFPKRTYICIDLTQVEAVKALIEATFSDFNPTKESIYQKYSLIIPQVLRGHICYDGRTTEEISGSRLRRLKNLSPRTITSLSSFETWLDIDKLSESKVSFILAIAFLLGHELAHVIYRNETYNETFEHIKIKHVVETFIKTATDGVTKAASRDRDDPNVELASPDMYRAIADSEERRETFDLFAELAQRAEIEEELYADIFGCHALNIVAKIYKLDRNTLVNISQLLPPLIQYFLVDIELCTREMLATTGVSDFGNREIKLLLLKRMRGHCWRQILHSYYLGAFSSYPKKGELRWIVYEISDDRRLPSFVLEMAPLVGSIEDSNGQVLFLPFDSIWSLAAQPLYQRSLNQLNAEVDSAGFLLQACHYVDPNWK